MDLVSPCPKTVTWKIATEANRVVARGESDVLGAQTLSWDQRDLKGGIVSNGVYFLRVSETGRPVRTVKILILR